MPATSRLPELASASPKLGRRGLLAAGVGLWALLVGLTRARDAAASGGFQVVVHAQHPASTVSRELLADIFLKKATRWQGGEPARPVDLRPDSSVRQQFSQSVIKRSVTAVRSYWTQRIFSGRELPPPEVDSDDAVIRFVSTHPGAVGYVSPQAALGSAKRIDVG